LQFSGGSSPKARQTVPKLFTGLSLSPSGFDFEAGGGLCLHCPEKEVFQVFPNKEDDSTSILVLKTPKTKGSVRWLYLTEPIVQELKRPVAPNATIPAR